MKELLKTIIKDFHQRSVPKTIPRDISIPLQSGKIVTVIGPRRAGKTYLLYQLISSIKDITNVIYINFEDERLSFTQDNLQLILEAYFELYPDKHEDEIYLFFDEIQEVPSWEKFIRRLYDTITKRIFITGSSAKMLSKELATALRGRAINYEVYPLSFKEYLRFTNTEEDTISTKGKAGIAAQFNTYLNRSGFPETAAMDDEVYNKTIESYFDVMLYRDIIERYNISTPLHVKTLLKKLLANISREFSINKIYNELKSQGIKIGKNSLYDYLGYFEDAFIVLPISSFSPSTTKQTLRKSYAIDIGLSRMVSFALSEDRGRILENVVLLELRRRNKDAYYHKNGSECDFIIKKDSQITEAIQVCYELTEDNRQREIESLTKAMEHFKLKSGIIITHHQEESAGNIKVIPAAKWLLEK